MAREQHDHDSWDEQDDEQQRQEEHRAGGRRRMHAVPEQIGEGSRAPDVLAVDVLRTYADQWLGTVRGGARWLVVPSAVRVDDPGEGPAGLAPMGSEAWHVLSAWSLGGDARTYAQNRAAQKKLAAAVVEAGGRVVTQDLCAVPWDFTWLEECLVVTGLDRETAGGLARQFGQEAFVEWTARHLAVLHARRPRRPHYRGWWCWVRRPLSCPLRADDHPFERCVMHGGGWTSGAIHAAALWGVHRDLMVAQLGCSPCADGSGAVAGPFGATGEAIQLSPVKIANRARSYGW